MTILAGDIKLVASQVMDDVPEGGGAPVATVIADGVSNAIFPDISELDRALGRVNLRKVFATVQTSNVDGYFGANVIVADAPDDPLVGVTLFSTGDTFDRREDAKARIEAYLSTGPTFAGYLFGNQIDGQSSISLLTRTNVAPPVVGDSLVLRKLEGTGAEFEQFVRVREVTVTQREFEDSQGVFTRNEVVLGLSDQLRADFPGFDAMRFDSSINYTGKTRVCTTVVADAARYYGVVSSTDAAAINDFSIQTSGIFSQLVPSAQIETPIADARMNQQASALVIAGAPFTQTLNLAFTTSQQMFVGGGIAPGTLTIVRDGITLIDSGGKLLNQATTQQVGTVDYQNGIVALATNVYGTSGGNHTVTYTPAAQPTVVSESIGIPVTQATQRLTYVVTLNPVPAKASVQVSYRAQGRWYVLSDDGSGALRGADSSVGVGTQNFTTGTLSLTLGALPDIGSEVIVSFKPAVANPRLSFTPIAPQVLSDRVFHAIFVGFPIKPGTLTVTWNDGTARTAGDLNGALTGTDAIGEVDYARGHIRISPNSLPPSGTVFNVDITQGTNVEADVATFTDGGSTWNFTTSGTTRAGSVEIGVAAQHAVRQYPGVDVTTTKLVRIFDDGAGNLKIASISGNLTIGSINYGTGACTIAKSLSGYQDVQPTFENKTPFGSSGTDATYIKLTGTETRTVTLTVLNGTGTAMTIPPWAWWTGSFGVSAKLKKVGNDGSAFNANFPLTSLVLKRAGRDSFTLGSDRYAKRTGVGFLIHRNPNPTTGEGAVAGEFSYSASYLYGVSQVYSYPADGGYILITLWTPGIGPSVSNSSGVVSTPVESALVDGVTFRTAITPLRNGSFSVVGEFQDGTTFNATADTNGEIKTGSNYISSVTPGSYGVFGRVNYETGVIKLRFGRRVHPDNFASPGVVDMSDLGLSGVQYVESFGAKADSLRYNASAFTYLPLDADILGIDPVRLPSDGRVPIFRAGTIAVVGHAKTVTATVSNGQTIDLARVRLSRVRVIGNNGVVINTGYTVDLEAGTITFTNVAGYSQPVTVEDRVEDMMLVREAQINGLLTFTRPLTHNYPTGSYVSSALIAGDLKARVSVLFDQQTFGSPNVWSDEVIGSNASATYNDALNPIEVSNVGAVTERWALVFTNSSTFNIVGEHVGQIATGMSINVDQSPINPATGQPYFTIRSTGWGTGWAAGNALRFNTVGASFPVWVVRTIQQGPETVDQDSFTLLVRGDIDNP